MRIEDKNKKKLDFILVIISYIITLVLVMQGYRAYLLSNDLKNFDINSILDNMINNMKNDFFFIPTAEYKNIIFVTTIAFFTGLLIIIIDSKKFMKGKEYGSAKWATTTEKKRFMDKKDDNNIILAEEIKVSLDSKKTRKNLNVLVIGGSGTGKTRFFVKPNLMQLNTSYIITDPKGELLSETGKMFQDNGYKIKVFNNKNMEETMCYNPFKYVKKEQDIFKLIKVLMKNTDDGVKGTDPFWEKAETALLQAIMLYLYYEVEEEQKNFNSILRLLRYAKISEENENEKSELDLMFEQLEEEKGETISVRQYKVFKAAAGKTAKTILISALSRLSFLDIPEIEKMFSCDELDIEGIGKNKTAFFVIIPDTDSSFNFLVAMLYTQMFDVLCQIGDSEGLNYPVRFILDEFANIGKIPDFEKVISTIRSRGISASIILQSIAQIESQYKETYKTIIDNCDNTVFLGGQETAEWVSKKLGKATIDSKSTNYTKGRNSSSTLNYSLLGRELMTKGEIEQMPDEDCICFIRGNPPMYSKKFKLEKHKRYKLLGDVTNPNNEKNFYFKDIRRLNYV